MPQNAGKPFPYTKNDCSGCERQILSDSIHMQVWKEGRRWCKIRRALNIAKITCKHFERLQCLNTWCSVKLCSLWRQFKIQCLVLQLQTPSSTSSLVVSLLEFVIFPLNEKGSSNLENPVSVFQKKCVLQLFHPLGFFSPSTLPLALLPLESRV